MRNELQRRVAAIETRLPASDRSPLTDDQFFAIMGMWAVVIIDRAGTFDPEGHATLALFRGIEKLLWDSDTTRSDRHALSRRYFDATALALNGGNGAAWPLDSTKQLVAAYDLPIAGKVRRDIGDLRSLCPSFVMKDRDAVGMSTAIDADGVESFRWPEQAGAERPDQQWRGQGFEAAAVYWSSRK